MTSWRARACDIVGRSFTHAEWARYFSDQPYRAKVADATCHAGPNRPLSFTSILAVTWLQTHDLAVRI